MSAAPPMFVVRPVRGDDLGPIAALARHLDSVNLPDDRALLGGIVARAVDSFAARRPPAEREYLFVLEEVGRGALVGTSMIHARHGTPEAPHIYFEVSEERRYSAMLDREQRHRVLRLGFDDDGPTELGGLVLLPALRGGGANLGRLLSYARFSFLGAHRPWFRDELLSELLPPLEPDGSSLLWDALGHHFTGLSYRDADRLCHRGKEFIRELFPLGPIYIDALPEAARARIGAVGAASRGVERMLEQIGFRWSGRIDPFDGGPHLSARTDEVTLVGALGRARVVDGEARGSWGIVAAEGELGFRALGLPLSASSDQVALPAPARQALGVGTGESVWVQPMVYVTNVSTQPTAFPCSTRAS